MANALRNLFALGVARRASQRGLLGQLFGIGLTRRVARRRGLTGGIARAGLAAQAARIGLGTVIGVGALAAGIYGARQVMQRRGMSDRPQLPARSSQGEIHNREEAPLR